MQPGYFETTHWSLVKAAGGPKDADARNALGVLCQTYWPAVYLYVRRWERNVESARDLTQEFFARLLERNTLAAADRERGRFRTFLLTALKHFLLDERAKAQAQKRGGGRTGLSLDFQEADARHRLEPFHEWTPERIFEREWALRLLDVVLDRLRAEYESAGTLERFECLKPTIGEGKSVPLAELALQLNLSETALRVATHRLRKRYRELLREEIAQTVTGPEEIEDELKQLFLALSEPP